MQLGMSTQIPLGRSDLEREYRLDRPNRIGMTQPLFRKVGHTFYTTLVSAEKAAEGQQIAMKMIHGTGEKP